MKDSLDQLHALLSRTRMRARARWTLCAAMVWIGMGLILGVALLVLAARGVEWTRPVAPWLPLAVGLGFVVTGPALALLRWRSPLDLARRVAPQLPTRALREGFLPAIELGATIRAEPRAQLADSHAAPADLTRALTQAHIDAVAAQVAPVRAIPIVPTRALHRCLGLFAAALACSMAAMTFGTPTLMAGARFLTEQPQETPLAVAREPIAGDIELTYRYPAYTRRADRVIANTNGEIAAPLGTQISLRARADRQVERATIALDGVEAPVVLDVRGGRELAGSFTLAGPGSYRFRFETRAQKIVAEGPPIAIAIEEDAAPTIELMEPLADVEVDVNATVRIAFEAEDDFGVESVALFYKLPGTPTPRRVALAGEGEPQRRLSGEHAFELSPLGLMAGDSVAFYLEARDGDLMSGPKTGVTPTRLIKIHSRADHHRRLLARLEEDFDKLIHLLGDRLEGADRRRDRGAADLAQGRKVDEAAAEFGLALQARAVDMEKAHLPAQLTTALRNIGQSRHAQALDTSRTRDVLIIGMRHGQRGPAAQRQAFGAALGREIDGIERDIIYLERLLDEQRTADLIQSAEELKSKQRQLAGLLEELRQSPSDETKARVMAEIARLKERMAELMRRMGELSRSIQDAHVNAEALRELSEAAKAMDAFDRLQDQLHRGEVEEAMKALDEIGAMLDTLQQQIEGASQELGGEANAALGRELDKFSTELGELTRSQEALLQETQRVREALAERRQKALRDRDEGFFDKLRAQVAEARERVDGLRTPVGFYGDEAHKAAKSALDDLATALRVEDLERSSAFSETALSKLERLAREVDRQRHFLGFGGFGMPRQEERNLAEVEAVNEARERIEAVNAALEALAEDSSQSLSAKEREKLKSLAEREAALRQKAEALGENMQALNESAPIFPDEARELMRRVGERMGEAEGGLREEIPSRSVRGQRAALEGLGELKKGLQEQGEAGGAAQGQGQRIPWPWGTGARARSHGGGRLDHDEKVDVPKADSYRVPEAYRKEILDAMKERSPERYQDQVRRYYEEIIK